MRCGGPGRPQVQAIQGDGLWLQKIDPEEQEVLEEVHTHQHTTRNTNWLATGSETRRTEPCTEYRGGDQQGHRPEHWAPKVSTDQGPNDPSTSDQPANSMHPVHPTACTRTCSPHCVQPTKSVPRVQPPTNPRTSIACREWLGRTAAYGCAASLHSVKPTAPDAPSPVSTCNKCPT